MGTRRDSDSSSTPAVPTGPSGQRRCGPSGGAGWVVHFDLDAFFASVETALDPRLAGRAVVVGGTGSRGVVSCASYPARALGLHAAMPMYRARRPGVVALPVRMRAYQAVSDAVRRVWAPLGEVSMRSLDEGSIRTVETDLPTLRRRIEAAGAEIAQRYALSVSVGVACSRVMAKMASELRKPGGVCVVEAGGEQALLDGLTVGKLPGCGPRSQQLLDEIGVRTVAELRRSDPRQVAALLGVRHAEVLLAAAVGADPPPADTPGRNQLSSARTFEIDVCGTDELTAAALDQAAAAFARRDGRAVRAVAVSVACGSGASATRRERLPAPTDETWRVADAVRRLVLDVHERVGRHCVRLVGVTFELAAAGGQGELFGPQGPELPARRERVVLLGDVAFHGMDILHERFGPGTVLHLDEEGLGVRFADRDRVLDPRLPAARVAAVR